MNNLRTIFSKVIFVCLMLTGSLFSASSATGSSTGEPGVWRRPPSVAAAAAGGGAGGTTHAADPTRRPGVDVPARGILFYIPESQAEPLVWTAGNRELLVTAIDKSGLGNVPGMPSNVFFVEDSWAERLKRDAGGKLANFHYLVEGDGEMTLWACPEQKLLCDAIRESGFRFGPNQSANVFVVGKEWQAPLKTAGAFEMLLAYVVRGDAALSIHYGPKKALVRDAIASEGRQHVVGQAPNIYWVSLAGAASLKAAIDGVSDVFFVVDREVFIQRTEREPIPGGFGSSETVRVRTCDNKGLLLQAIDDSKIGLAYKDNVFYVTREWFAKLNELSKLDIITYPWTTTQKVIAVVALGSAAALACNIQ